MKQAKPLLTIKQKCGECGGIKIIIDKSVEKDIQMKAGVYVCKFCKSIQQTTEIYALRDFKCSICDGQGGWTELKPAETQLSHKSHNLSGGE